VVILANTYEEAVSNFRAKKIQGVIICLDAIDERLIAEIRNIEMKVDLNARSKIAVLRNSAKLTTPSFLHSKIDFFMN
jgi:hypothetical protein